MRRRILMLVVALAAGVLLGLLGACSAATKASIESITTTQQLSNEVAITNYSINYKQTPAEWQALSTEEKVKLAQLGFDQALEQIAADGTSNFNIMGMTAPGTDAEGNQIAAQSTLYLNHELGVLMIHNGVDVENKAIIVTEVPVELP
jgi:ABC-type glycerol-3-phosphate transport system substrate-binding protein